MPTYVSLIHKNPDSDYGVSFPDLPGCATAGKTLDEAITMAAEALALHLEGITAGSGRPRKPRCLYCREDQMPAGGLAT